MCNTFVVLCVVNCVLVLYLRSPELCRLSNKLRVLAQPYTGLSFLFDRVIKPTKKSESRNLKFQSITHNKNNPTIFKMVAKNAQNVVQTLLFLEKSEFTSSYIKYIEFSMERSFYLSNLKFRHSILKSSQEGLYDFLRHPSCSSGLNLDFLDHFTLEWQKAVSAYL